MPLKNQEFIMEKNKILLESIYTIQIYAKFKLYYITDIKKMEK